jgi:hypothetical protein
MGRCLLCFSLILAAYLDMKSFFPELKTSFNPGEEMKQKAVSNSARLGFVETEKGFKLKL